MPSVVARSSMFDRREALGVASPRARAQRGFTLVELMVVVAIVAVLSGLAAVMVRGERYGHAEGYAAQIKTQLETASQRAVARSRVQRIEVRREGLVHWEGCAPAAAGEPCPPTGMREPDELRRVGAISAPAPELVIGGMIEQTARQGVSQVPSEGGLPGVIDFFPDGTAQAATIFVDHEHRPDERFRIGVFQASGYVNIWRGWN